MLILGLGKLYFSFLYHFIMALAKWARIEEPKPYSLLTRREVDKWILPHITRNDTMHSVLER